MTCENDTPHLNVDVPIPYRVTPRGRNAILDGELLELQLRCTHTWTTDLAIGLVCGDCGWEVSAKRESIPGYLSPKGRDRK